jgi:hypothetical protein
MQYDPTDTDEQDRQADEKAAGSRVAADNEDADFKWLMGSRRGRRIVWGAIERAGVFRSSFNTNSMAMAFNEGRKNEGLRVLAKINALCPDLYAVMAKEATE